MKHKFPEQLNGLRIENNLSRVQLAEKLNVTRQAVSNWERGNSMPDISKLPEIAELFQVSIDEILGKRNPILKEVANGEKVVLTNHLKTDVDEAATLMKPQQIKEMIDYSEFNPKVISALLPFLDSEYVEELMNKCKDAGKSIAVFLPFLSEERIDELAEEANTNGESFMMFLPFRSKENLRKLAYEAFDRGGLKEASPFFPFMQDKDLKNLAEKSITLD